MSGSERFAEAYPKGNFLAINHSGCVPAEHTPPGWEEIKTTPGMVCYPGLFEVIEQFVARRPLSRIILSDRYRPKTWRAIEQSTPILSTFAPVTVIGAGPTFRLTMEEYLKALPPFASLPQSMAETDTSIIPWSFSNLAKGAEIVSRNAGASFVNISDDYCPDGACILWTTSPLEPLFADEMHVSSFGHKFFVEVFGREETLQELLAEVQGQAPGSP